MNIFVFLALLIFVYLSIGTVVTCVGLFLQHHYGWKGAIEKSEYIPSIIFWPIYFIFGLGYLIVWPFKWFLLTFCPWSEKSPSDTSKFSPWSEK